jgi:hypothetical protein
VDERTGLTVTIRPCEGCGKPEPRKWKHEGRWVCVACLAPAFAPVKCDRGEASCGLVASLIPGIDRHALGNAVGDRYYLRQALVFRCPAGHITPGPVQWGPGAPPNTAGEPA